MLEASAGTRSDDRCWRHATGVTSLARPLVMAVLNVTPDSFHDGGRFGDSGASIDVPGVKDAAQQAVRDGASILDIGGESTRPGAAPVDAQQEWERVGDVLANVVALGVPISCDTRRASVAARAMEAGASILNDVSGLADPQMAAVAAKTGAGLVIGHMRGVPGSMQDDIVFEDVVQEVGAELSASVARAVAAGVEPARIVVDPGIGFGKTAQQSAALVVCGQRLRAQTGCAVMIGASRKSFIGKLSPGAPHQRLPGSLVAAAFAAQAGADVLRVHDVAETLQALRVAEGIALAGAGGGL